MALLATRLSAREIVLSKWIGSIRPAVTAQWLMPPMLMLAWWHGGLSLLAVPLAMGWNVLVAGLVAAIGLAVSMRQTRTTSAMLVTILILTLWFGVGHLAVGSLYSSFGGRSERVFDKDVSIPAALFWASLPFMTCVQIFFRSHESGHWVNVQPTLFGAIGVVSALIALVTGLLLLSMIRRFPGVTGRTEAVCVPARPMPPATPSTITR
jgi:hypothetical protein